MMRRILPFTLLSLVVASVHAGEDAKLKRDVAYSEAGVAAMVVPAGGKTHATINQDLGKADDAPTRAVFEFLRDRFEKPDAKEHRPASP